MNKKKISIIVVTYNNQEEIVTCMESIFNYSGLNKQSFEVIIIDNNSDDLTADKIRQCDLDVKLVENKENKGFAKSVNQGIQLSTYDLVLLLNPDTEIINSAIKTLRESLNENKADVIGGKLIKEGGEVHGSFVREPTLGDMFFEYTNLRKLDVFNYFHNRHYYNDKSFKDYMQVDAVSGAYMLFYKKRLSNINYFDENFFMYLEDVDFCVRATERGCTIGFCPSSTIIHKGGASSKNVDRIRHDAWYHSRSYYAKKHFSATANLVIQPIFYLDMILSLMWKKLKS